MYGIVTWAVMHAETVAYTRSDRMCTKLKKKQYTNT